jgi:thymidylate kinase
VDFEAGMDLNLSRSVTTSFLEYQKLLRKAFTDAAEEQGFPVVQTRHSVEEVHAEIWRVLQPHVSDMLHPL